MRDSCRLDHSCKRCPGLRLDTPQVEKVSTCMYSSMKYILRITMSTLLLLVLLLVSYQLLLVTISAVRLTYAAVICGFGIERWSTLTVSYFLKAVRDLMMYLLIGGIIFLLSEVVG